MNRYVTYYCPACPNKIILYYNPPLDRLRFIYCSCFGPSMHIMKSKNFINIEKQPDKSLNVNQRMLMNVIKQNPDLREIDLNQSHLSTLNELQNLGYVSIYQTEL